MSVPTSQPKQLACTQCTKAKRKCNKQIPACRRCSDKGIDCLYPPMKVTIPLDYAYLQPAMATAIHNHMLQAHSQPGGGGGGMGVGVESGSGSRGSFSRTSSFGQPTPPTSQPSSGFDPLLFGSLSDSGTSGDERERSRGRNQNQNQTQMRDSNGLGLHDPWFLRPESWKIEHHSGPNDIITLGDTSLYQFVKSMQDWLRQWLSAGHNPMLHAQLWGHAGGSIMGGGGMGGSGGDSRGLGSFSPGGGMPECLQDAYTSVAAYLAKTSETELLTLKIIENRADKLIREQQQQQANDAAMLMATDDGSGNGGSTTTPEEANSMSAVVMLDTYTHLARTQALTMYKAIRLFDGDVRARARAEADMDVLRLWAAQLWDSASLDIAVAAAGSGTGAGPGMEHLGGGGGAGAGEGSIFHRDGSLPSLWRAWVLAESVRRTWLAAQLVQSVYLILKQGFAPCPGAITFTARSGLWDAQSPRQWLQRARQTGWLPVSTLASDFIFDEAQPGDVDEFTSTVLVVSHGLERVEQWIAEREDYSGRYLW